MHPAPHDASRARAFRRTFRSSIHKLTLAGVTSLAVACHDPAGVAPSGPDNPAQLRVCTVSSDCCVACAPTPGPKPFDTDRFGVATFVEGGMGDYQSFADLTTGTGARWVRMPVDWSVLQPDNSTSWNQGALDQLTRAVERARSANAQVMITLQNTPVWARLCPPGSSSNPSLCSTGRATPPHPLMYAYWRQFVGQMVSKYPYVQAWGIWNEPNAPDQLVPWPGERAQDEYVLLVGYAADAIHAVAGKQLVAPEVGGVFTDEPPVRSGFIDSRSFLREILTRAGNSIDVVSVHDYSGTVGTSRTQHPSLFNHLGQYADILAGRWPMWLTEFGFDVDVPAQFQGDGSGAASGDYKGRFSEALRVANIGQVAADMRSNAVGEWKKSFVFSGVTPMRPSGDGAYSLVRGFPAGNPQPTPGYYCFQQLVLGALSCS